MIIMVSALPRCSFRLTGVLLFILLRPRNNELLNSAHSIKRWQTRQRFPVHPDCEGLAHHQVIGHGAPEPAVVTVVAVVAHHKVMPLRHYPFTFTATADTAHGQVYVVFNRRRSEERRVGKECGSRCVPCE